MRPAVRGAGRGGRCRAMAIHGWLFFTYRLGHGWIADRVHRRFSRRTGSLRIPCKRFATLAAAANRAREQPRLTVGRHRKSLSEQPTGERTLLGASASGVFARCIHEEAVVMIGSETSVGFSRHPFGIILSECVAKERQEMRFGDSHSVLRPQGPCIGLGCHQNPTLDLNVERCVAAQSGFVEILINLVCVPFASPSPRPSPLQVERG